MHKIISGVTLLLLCGSLYSQSLDDTLSIDEVVITGMRVEVSRKILPLNVSVISKDHIDEIEESAILPIVSRRIPSLFVNERGVTGFGRTGSASAGNISIRGIGGNPNAQVLVLVDGHPQYMGIFGHPLPNNYVASDLERVEIIRGPSSILYGSNAMGGVLNFITRKQLDDGFTGSMRVATGSYSTKKMMVNTGYKKGKFDFFVSYNHDDTRGHRENMDFRIDNSYIKAGYRIGKHLRLSADFNIADMKSLDPGMKDSASEVFVADMVRGKASVALSNKFDKMEGSLFAFMNFGEHDFSDGWQSVDENSGISFFEGISLLPGNLVTIGFDHKSYGGRGNAGFPPNTGRWLSVNETGLYLITEQSFMESKINLSAGARFEDHSLFGSSFIPQAGFAINLIENTSLKASVSGGYRSPTIMELFLFAPNPDLLPEESINYETGISTTFMDGKLATEITLYNVRGSNLIEMDYSVGPPPSRKNSGEFNHRGIEVEARYIASENFSADLSYSYLSMDVPRLAAPGHQFFTGMNYSRDKLTLALQANYIGKLYISTLETEGIGQEITADYFLLNGSLKYRMNESVEFFISGKNLLNQDYQIDYGYPMPGINFMTGAGIHF